MFNPYTKLTIRHVCEYFIIFFNMCIYCVVSNRRNMTVFSSIHHHFWYFLKNRFKLVFP